MDRDLKVQMELDSEQYTNYAIAVSDVHLGYGGGDKNAFKKFLQIKVGIERIRHLLLVGDILDMWRRDNESLIKELLPVIDNLEMAIEHSQDGTAVEALREGVELTLKGLKDSLEKSGLEEIKALGDLFDPCFHQAVSEQEDKSVDSGSILVELQKGYTLNERLIRPAMVVVSKGGSGSQNDKECKNE